MSMNESNAEDLEVALQPEIKQEVWIQDEDEDEPEIDIEPGEQGVKVTDVKDVKIFVKNLYCYICHKNFESLAQFQSHDHDYGRRRKYRKNRKSCLDNDDDGINVTCHKCRRIFSSLTVFLNHLQRTTGSREKDENFDADFQNGKMNSIVSASKKRSKCYHGDKNEPCVIQENHLKDSSNNTFPGDENKHKDDSRLGDDADEFDLLDLHSDGEVKDDDDHDDDEDWDGFKPTPKLKGSQHMSSRRHSAKTKTASNSSTHDEDEKRSKSRPVCKICDKVFSYRHVLYKHIRRLHDPNYLPSLFRGMSDAPSKLMLSSYQGDKIEAVDNPPDVKNTQGQRVDLEDDKNEDEDDRNSSGSEYSPVKRRSTLRRPRKSSTATDEKTRESIVIVSPDPETKEDDTMGRPRAVCSVCGKSFSYRHVLYKHIRKKHDPNFIAPVLRKKSSTSSSKAKSISCLNSAPRSKVKSGSNSDNDDNQNTDDQKSAPVSQFVLTSGGRFTCDLCGKSYSYKYVLYKHLRRVHGPAAINLKPGRKRVRVNYDEEGNKRDQSVICRVAGCGKRLSCNQSLKYHMKTQHRHPHRENPEDQHRCPYPDCNKSFVLKGYLRQHITGIHETNKTFLCDQCPMKFVNRHKLAEHHRIHSGEKPYLCDFCPMTFTHSCNFRRHLQTHAGHCRTYLCEWEGCGKRFNMRQTLKRHQQQHTGIRPYTCPICPVAFHDNKPLKKHMALVHPGVPLLPLQQRATSFTIVPVLDQPLPSSPPPPPPSLVVVTENPGVMTDNTLL